MKALFLKQNIDNTFNQLKKKYNDSVLHTNLPKFSARKEPLNPKYTQGPRKIFYWQFRNNFQQISMYYPCR